MIRPTSFHRLIFAGILSILYVNILPAQQAKPVLRISENFCISENEFVLAKMINDYRLQNNLAVIPLSKSMFYVARTHIEDLARNRPESEKCGLQSWSDQGKWKPCCYGNELGKTNCMNDKPKELCGYKGKGYEMIYWGSEEAIPSDAIDVWKSTALTNEMMLNQGKWKNMIWKSVGVGLLNGYASVWFGDETDYLQGIRLCNNDSLIDSKISVSNELPVIEPGQNGYHFFLITGSFKTRKEAEEHINYYINKGYNNSRVIEKDKLFRIAIASYHSPAEAQKELNKLAHLFKGIWILHY
jgi:hypothetical protein